MQLSSTRLAEPVAAGCTLLASPVDYHDAANHCEPQQKPKAIVIDIVQAAD
jgi:hypothetical protein